MSKCEHCKLKSEIATIKQSLAKTHEYAKPSRRVQEGRLEVVRARLAKRPACLCAEVRWEWEEVPELRERVEALERAVAELREANANLARSMRPAVDRTIAYGASEWE